MSTSEGTLPPRLVRNLPWAGPAVVDDIPMTESTAARPIPCGTWPSPITASNVAGHQCPSSFPLAADGEVWWQELLPGEHGRTTVMHVGADGKRRQLLPAPWNARTTVHEYGGRSYLPVPTPEADGQRRWAMVFANYADQ